jgi:hypothetical protein
MSTIRDASPNGGFVRNLDGAWYEVGDRNAREKIGQAFRDLLHDRYRSSTKSKASKRRLRVAGPDADSSTSSNNSSQARASSTVPATETPAYLPAVVSSNDLPISEVSFPVLTESAQQQDDLHLKDLEPLPLSQGLEFVLTSSNSMEDSASSFEEAMEGLLFSSGQLLEQQKQQEHMMMVTPKQSPFLLMNVHEAVYGRLLASQEQQFHSSKDAYGFSLKANPMPQSLRGFPPSSSWFQL